MAGKSFRKKFYGEIKHFTPNIIAVLEITEQEGGCKRNRTVTVWAPQLLISHFAHTSKLVDTGET
jgi:hypothetical protein